ncbi:MAG: hypothetical protein ILP17_00455 [Lachnospiraceae bacterium]|nr:hypothetical protein [Lachnospiraceae bacterium]MBP1584149.1 hypothetical protein [Lachnospiraceae bacterium]
MNNDKGAAADCASFAIMVKGYAGSYGAAARCLEAAEAPEGVRPDLWKRLRTWSEKKMDAYASSAPVPGIHRMLWDIGSKGYGFRVRVRDIPLEQEAVEICEALGLNIYETASADLEISLEKYPYPEDPVLIGYASEGKDKLLVNGDDVSFLNRPAEQCM